MYQVPVQADMATIEPMTQVKLNDAASASH